MAKEREIYRAQAQASGKPEKVLDKIVDGMVGKYFAEACLLEQDYVKEPKKRVEDVLKEVSGQLRENLVIRRFVRFQLGEASEGEAGSAG